MKKILCLILALALAVVLAGCGKAADAHPEWDSEWVRLGERMAVPAPEGFEQQENNDALSVAGIWVLTWTKGEAREVINAEGNSADAYDAQLYLLVRACEGEEAAAGDVADWMEREKQNYSCGDAACFSSASVEWEELPLLAAAETNPYSHGAAAFGTYEDLAICAELLCEEGFEQDAGELLEAFLEGIRFGE